jgi:hypothetical protein
VRVLDDGAGPDRAAIPPPEWQPTADPLSGLTLNHRPGEPLNAAWVRRQFDMNLRGGAGAGRAVALVQLINRAFLSAGFVNSGLPRSAGKRPGYADLSAWSTPPHPGAGQHGGDRRGFRRRSARGLDPDYVRERFPSAARQPLSAVAIERDFRLLTEDPALRTVNRQLRPGAGPGRRAWP